MSSEKVLDISWGTIWKFFLAAILIFVLYQVKEILIWFIFALIISILVNPVINFLKKFLPRFVAVLFIYLSALAILGLSLYLIAPVFFIEIQQFYMSFPEYFETLSPALHGLGVEAFQDIEYFIAVLEEQLVNISTGIFAAVGAIFGGLFATIVVFSLAIFLSLEENALEKVIRFLSPKKHEAAVLSIFDRSRRKIGGWFGARIVCCIFVGLMTFIATWALDTGYSVSFGLFAGLTNIIPYIGPVIGGAIITIIILANNWWQALFFLIIFVIIQQIESSVLSPVLTGKFIGMSPALILIVVLIGGNLWGIMGAIFAIPMAGILFEFLKEFLEKKKTEKAVVL